MRTTKETRADLRRLCEASLNAEEHDCDRCRGEGIYGGDLCSGCGGIGHWVVTIYDDCDESDVLDLLDDLEELEQRNRAQGQLLAMVARAAGLPEDSAPGDTVESVEATAQERDQLAEKLQVAVEALGLARGHLTTQHLEQAVEQALARIEGGGK